MKLSKLQIATFAAQLLALAAQLGLARRSHHDLLGSQAAARQVKANIDAVMRGRGCVETR